MNKLKQWKEDSGLEWKEIAEKTGVSEQALFDIIGSKTDDMKVSTAIKIERLTGLKFQEYTDFDPLGKLARE